LSAKSKKSSLVILFSVVIIIVLCLVLGLTILLNNQRPPLLSDCVVSTKERAVEIALPFAQEYAQENNRTITTAGSDVFYIDSRPCWDVGITFEAIKPAEKELHSDQYFISGYSVSIWGDTGEIRYCQPIDMALVYGSRGMSLGY
jgi:hypothetical protein